MRGLLVAGLCGLFATMGAKAWAGQMILLSLEDLEERSGLIAVVEVTKVTQTEAPTDPEHVVRIQIAEAVVKKTVKSDYTPVTEGRRIAIVGSTLPRTSAAFRPIKEGKYLAFLTRTQGHYQFSFQCALRPIDEDSMVTWYTLKEDGNLDTTPIKLAEAIALTTKLVDKP